jgi:Inner membrane protein YgaP-like, transmembrane domain
MTVDDSLRAIAGAFILISLALGTWVHPAFYLFTAFVGLNLFQSGFSKWCPMMAILRKLGVREQRA